MCIKNISRNSRGKYEHTYRNQICRRHLHEIFHDGPEQEITQIFGFRRRI